MFYQIIIKIYFINALDVSLPLVTYIYIYHLNFINIININKIIILIHIMKKILFLIEFCFKHNSMIWNSKKNKNI
jgi:hypothetical protein